MVIRHWEMNTISAEKSRLLSEEYGLPKLLSDILVSRGLDSPLAVEDFLNGAGELSDPFLRLIWKPRQNASGKQSTPANELQFMEIMTVTV